MTIVYFPDSIVANNIVFEYESSYATLDQARREAKYIRREGYYSRVVKKADRYGVYSARKG